MRAQQQQQQHHQQQQSDEDDVLTSIGDGPSSVSQRRRLWCKLLLPVIISVVAIFFGYHNIQQVPILYYGGSSSSSSEGGYYHHSTTNGTEATPTFQEDTSASATSTNHSLSSPPSARPSSVGKLFYCGWSSSPEFIFPEYEYQRTKWNRQQIQGTTPDDILVIGMYGPCLGYPRFFKRGGPAMSAELFPGKVLWINGEAYGDLTNQITNSTNQRLYQIGPYSPPSAYHPTNSLLVYYFVVYFGFLTMDDTSRSASANEHNNPIIPNQTATTLSTSSSSSLWDWIFDPDQRRTNTGKYPGVAYFASHCVKFRQRAAQQISQIVTVYHGSGCKIAPSSLKRSRKLRRQLQEHEIYRGDINATISSNGSITATSISYTNNTTNASIPSVVHMSDDSDTGRGSYHQNYEFFHDFKYCIVMENKAVDGYISEKILNGFLAGCVPIYYGTRQVFDIFNADAFLFYDVDDPQPTLDRIRYLERNHDDYVRMLHVPVLKNGTQTVNDYFSLYPNVGNGQLNRKIRAMMGIAPYDENK
jgi:hypothetical protein